MSDIQEVIRILDRLESEHSGNQAFIDTCSVVREEVEHLLDKKILCSDKIIDCLFYTLGTAVCGYTDSRGCRYQEK